MADRSPHGPGDDIYEQAGWTKTYPLDSGVAAVKGVLMTMNADGHLVALAGSGAALSGRRGLFQPKADRAAETYTANADAPTVQCLIPPSMIIMKAPANVVAGDRVQVAVASGTADGDKVEIANAVETIDFLGRVHEIYTRNSDGTFKLKTADDDLIIVHTGVL